MPHAQSEHKPDPQPDSDLEQNTSQGNFQWEDRTLQKLDEMFQKDHQRGIEERQELKEKLHDLEQKAIMYEMCLTLLATHSLSLSTMLLLQQ